MCAIIACVQATAAPTQDSPAALAEELLRFWHFLMRGTSRHLWALLEELDVSMTHVKALHALSECRAELSVKELSEELGLSLPATSRTVETLLRRGYLERREDEQDRRIKRVRITGAGREVVDRIDTVRLAGLEQFTSRLSPGQRARLLAALSDLPHRS